jgi:hypothetical protein
MTNPRSLANLKLWKPGESGNLKGRPPKSQPITDEIRRLVGQPVKPLEFELLQNHTYAQAIAKKLLDTASFGSPRVAVAAIALVLDRLESRPAQRVDAEKSVPAESAKSNDH